MTPILVIVLAVLAVLAIAVLSAVVVRGRRKSARAAVDGTSAAVGELADRVIDRVAERAGEAEDRAAPSLR